MAGMRALGRVYDVVPAASGIDVCVKDASGVGVFATTSTTAATSIAVVAKPSFGGSATNWTPGNGFGQPNTWFSKASNTAHWASNAAVWTTNSLALDGTINHMSYVDFLTSQFADTFDYINITATNCVIHVMLYDLTVARIPANMRIPSA